MARTWVEISASALRHNLRSWQKIVGPKIPIMPVVKANAYGHGIKEVAQILQNQRLWGLGVAYGAEALLLRPHYRGKILILSFWETAELSNIVRHNTDVVVWDRGSWLAVQRLAQIRRQPMNVHLKLDSGTSRIGFLPEDLPWLQQQLKLTNTNVQVVGIFSHLANSEEGPTTRTLSQLRTFGAMLQDLHLHGVATHIACTASSARYPASRHNLVRIGLGLYGLYPSSAICQWASRQPGFSLQPVLSWKSVLMQVKKIPAGTGVGYGSTVITKKATTFGLVPVGYADGYDRELSNRGWAMINGRRANVMGRVSMNLLALNLTNIPRPKSGQIVTLIGREVAADDLAQAGHQISYELLSRISPSIERRIV